MEQPLMLLGICLYLLLLTWPSAAQQVPPVACPQYFKYLGYDQQYVGRVSVRLNPQFQENTVRVEFSQRGSLSSEYAGSLSLWDDERTTEFNLRNNLPIQYRVDFPIPGVLPKLTSLMINDVVLCRASPYPGTSVTLSLSRSLSYSTMPFFAQQPQFIDQTFEQPVRPLRPQRPQRPQAPQSPQAPQRPFQPQNTPVWQGTIEQLPAPAPPPTPAPTSPPTPPPTQSAIQRVRPQPTPAAPRGGGQGLGQLGGICGREGPITSPLIYLGTEVRRGQQPWMAALFERGSDGLRFFCGGSLISASTVLSAAHCFRFASRNLTANRAGVSLGRNILNVASDGQLLEVSALLIHEEYTTENYANADIALLKLSLPVSFGQYIKPICLWNENYLLQLPSGYKTYVAGWGSDENGNGNTRVAKMTDTDIVIESECQENLKSTEAIRLLTPNTICAANKRAAGPCSGDSGGGLMLQENNIWVLRGVVSAGQVLANRCDLTKPVIYTDLARHITWLREKIWF